MANNILQFRRIEFTYESRGGTTTAVFQTDMPGGALADRVTMTLPATTGTYVPTKISFPLDAVPTEGRQYRIICTPAASATFIRYGTKLEVRQIGEAYDGARAERWQTIPQPV